MISKLLLDKGLYATRARITVLKIIAEHNGLTANSIYIEANKESELKIGTIYRVLYDLEKYNLIKRILFGRKKSIYKLLNQKINCNVRDISNGDVSPYNNPDVNVLLEEILNKIGNEFSTIDLILYK